MSKEDHMKEINEKASLSANQCKILGHLAVFSERVRRGVALKRRFPPWRRRRTHSSLRFNGRRIYKAIIQLTHEVSVKAAKHTEKKDFEYVFGLV